MKRFRPGPVIILGITLLVAIVLWGGWILLDKFFSFTYLSSGTRTLYQETSRANAMEHPLAYVGSEQCGKCHPFIEQEWLHSAHKTVACENCHGPASAHVESGVPIPANTADNLCLTCHARLAAKPEIFPQVEPEEHSQGLPCLQCHNPMHPDMSRPPPMPHALFEKADCLTCHGSPGFRSVPPDHEQRAGESCPQCHKQGG